MVSLQIFYGGSPMEWMRMPSGIVEAYASLMKTMQARQHLSRITELMVGTGTMKKENSREIIRAWKRDARLKGAVLKPTEEEKVAMMQGVGIQVG